MPWDNRLAPKPQNAFVAPQAPLGMSIPQASRPGMAQVDPRLGLGQTAQNVSAGVGQTLVGQLEGLQQLIQNPKATVSQMWGAAKAIGADPMIVVQMLRDARRKAMSGPIGFGEVAGEFLPSPNRQPAPKRIAEALEAAPTASRFPTALPTVKPGDVIDGYKVRPDIPNQSSIAASFDNYEVLPGIRSISMTEFDPQYVRSISPDKLDSRTRKLMDEISQSKELNPLIVAYDSKGPYIIEGGHRFDALIASKAKSVPAMVVIDMDNPPR
jgi:hypothetical protein